ncbi:MAG: phytoene desaturase family protein, partial [Bacteroidia bacterium]
MQSGKKVLIIGAGLGGLSTALRLSSAGYQVEIVEKYHQAGGRLNQMKKDGFTFDIGPSFFSMSYEFDELFRSCNIPNPLKLKPLDPVYSVFFEGKEKPFHIHRSLKMLAEEFKVTEPDFEQRAIKYLKKAATIFHDTENRVIKKNFNSILHYLFSLSKVPVKHTPYLFRSMWTELEKHFKSEEVKVIFSLVAFFLGATPFDTPAIYSLLNYTELEHDGYWHVEGGMYQITESLLKLLDERNVKIHYNTEIKSIGSEGKEIHSFIDQYGKKWQADIYVSNSDAAAFRGEVVAHKKYTAQKLDKMHWTLSPFTIYLGVKGKIDKLQHHNYFLGNNFRQYSDTIFKTSISPQKPYYYVNAA